MHTTIYTDQSTSFFNDFSCKDTNKKVFTLYTITMEVLIGVAIHGVLLKLSKIKDLKKHF